MATFVTSTRGKDKLIYQNYIYRHQRTRGNKHYWTCEDKTCRGRAVTTGEVFNSPTTEVKSSSEHNHPAEATRADTLRTVEQIRSQATDTAEAPAAIQQRVLAGAAADVAPYLPSANALRQVIQRKRRAELPIEPDGLHAIDIPEELRTTINGDDFTSLTQ